MKSRDIVTIASIALTTATLTLAVFWPSTIAAGNDGSLTEKIPIPTLALDHAEITLRSVEGRVFAEGEEPAFELKAVNTSDQPASIAVDIAMKSTNLDRRMSRALPASLIIWQQREVLTLNPHETKTFMESTKTKLLPKSRTDVYLSPADSSSLSGVIGRSGPSAIVALSFSTVTGQPAAEPGPQTSR